MLWRDRGGSSAPSCASGIHGWVMPVSLFAHHGITTEHMHCALHIFCRHELVQLSQVTIAVVAWSCRYVDLGVSSPVVEVVMYLRADGCCLDRHRNLTVRVGDVQPSAAANGTSGNPICWAAAPDSTYTVLTSVVWATCSNIMHGRFVSIEIVSNPGVTNDVISVAEVGGPRLVMDLVG